MRRKNYQQHYSGLAIALDLLGDRWSLLILHELWLGERRFTDLRLSLPGIATNLLSDRLRELKRNGLLEQRVLPAPAARTVYTLTAEGCRVVPVLRALSRFGLPLLDDPGDGGVRPTVAVHATLGALFDPVAAAGRDLLMRFDLDGEQVWLQVRAGVLARPGRGETPDLAFVGSAAALVDMCRGRMGPGTSDPRIHVDGAGSARRVFAEMFPPLCN